MIPPLRDPENELTILVDEARWPWRGTKWCHLVSDDNFAELHTFAGEIGQRRVGFQGDHYDIDVDTREIALAHGAVPAESREIVRRMKNAGLRRRPSTFQKWQLVERSDVDGAEPSEVLADPILKSYLDVSSGWFVLSRESAAGGAARGVVVLGSELPDDRELPAEDIEAGLFSRIDHHGNFSIERISPPPTERE